MNIFKKSQVFTWYFRINSENSLKTPSPPFRLQIKSDFCLISLTASDGHADKPIFFIISRSLTSSPMYAI